MKNTRISKLKRNKKFKQATKLLTVGLLVCPLAIGTIKALADETETTTPPVEQVAETPATIEEVAPVEETETIESVQPEVIEESQPVPEQQPIETTEAETAQSFNDPQADITQEITPQKNLINSWYSIKGPDIIESGETASYRFFFYEVYDNNTSIEEELTLEEMGAQLTSSDPSDVISGNTITFGNAGTRDISAGSGSLRVEVTDENHTLYRVREVFEDGSPLLGGSPTSDRRYATAGEEVTEVAQEIPGCSVIGESIQTKIIASDGSTVFTFVYRTNVDKTKLKQAIEEAEAKLAEGGWKDTTELETLLEYAKSALASNYPPQGIIDDITASLIAALSALEKEETEIPTLDELKAEWDKIFNECTSINRRIMDKVIGTEFEERYNQIFAVYDQCMLSESLINQVPTESQIIFYTNWLPKLKTALADFKQLEKDLNATQPEAPTTDKLATSIKDAESKLTETGYTEESMKALRQALQNAKDVLANANSTQAEIDEAQKALDLAIAGLVKAEDSNNNNTGSNGSNGTGNSTIDPNNSNSGTANNTNNATSNTNNQSNNNNSQNSSTATNKPTSNNANKDGLPQTGEQSTTNAVIAGLSLTMLSMLAWFKRKKV